MELFLDPSKACPTIYRLYLYKHQSTHNLQWILVSLAHTLPPCTITCTNASSISSTSTSQIFPMQQISAPHQLLTTASSTTSTIDYCQQHQHHIVATTISSTYRNKQQQQQEQNQHRHKSLSKPPALTATATAPKQDKAALQAAPLSPPKPLQPTPTPLTQTVYSKEYVHLEGKRGGGWGFFTQIEPNWPLPYTAYSSQ